MKKPVNDKTPEKSLKARKAEEREARLAEALRANLRRRREKGRVQDKTPGSSVPVHEEGENEQE